VGCCLEVLVRGGRYRKCEGWDVVGMKGGGERSKESEQAQEGGTREQQNISQASTTQRTLVRPYGTRNCEDTDERAEGMMLELSVEPNSRTDYIKKDRENEGISHLPTYLLASFSYPACTYILRCLSKNE